MSLEGIRQELEYKYIHALLRERGVAYNSHGYWSSLGKIREIELERGNPFPDLAYPDDTPAIWICLSRRKALRYMVLASEWERVDDETESLTPEEEGLLEYIDAIPVKTTDVIVWDDGDDGWLLLSVE